MGLREGVALLVLVFTMMAAGCTQDRDDAGVVETLAARLEQLERRLAVSDTHAELTALTRRLGTIEARLEAVEVKGAGAECHDATTPPANASRPADPGSAAQSPSARAEAVLQRRQRLKGVAEEDRARVARLREQFPENADPAARRQAMHEMRAWRRSRVKELGLRDNATQ